MHVSVFFLVYILIFCTDKKIILKKKLINMTMKRTTNEIKNSGTLTKNTKRIRKSTWLKIYTDGFSKLTTQNTFIRARILSEGSLKVSARRPGSAANSLLGKLAHSFWPKTTFGFITLSIDLCYCRDHLYHLASL